MLNRVIMVGITNEALNSEEELREKVMQTLDKENAPIPAKMLVAQVIQQKWSDAMKQEIRKLVTKGPDDGPDADDAEGVSDDEAMDQPVEDDQGVDDDKTTLNEDAGSGAMTMGNGNGKGTKKMLCIYAPENLRYCVSQLKEL